jgi:hypothetical protein
MNPSLPAADLMNSDDSIFSADSGAHLEFSLQPRNGRRRSPVSIEPVPAPDSETSDPAE